MQLIKFNFNHHEYFKKKHQNSIVAFGKADIFFKLEALVFIFGDLRGKRRFIPCCDKEFSCQKYCVQAFSEKETRFLFHIYWDYSVLKMF